MSIFRRPALVGLLQIFGGFLVFAWFFYGLALIRVDYFIETGFVVYVPVGSLLFESVVFAVLVFASMAYVLFVPELVSRHD